MVYYFDADNDVYMYVQNPDSSMQMAEKSIRGTNTIRGQRSTDLVLLRTKTIEELQKNERNIDVLNHKIVRYDEIMNEHYDTLEDKLDMSNMLLRMTLFRYYVQPTAQTNN